MGVHCHMVAVCIQYQMSGATKIASLTVKAVINHWTFGTLVLALTYPHNKSESGKSAGRLAAL